MTTRAYFERLFHHMRWADQKVLEGTVPDGGGADAPPSVRFLAHLLAAEEIWLVRLRGGDTAGLAVWPDDSLEACRVRARRVHGEWEEFLSTLPDLVEGSVEYRNSSGVAFTSGVADVLTHVFLHGSYHRGQIARELRLSGLDPVNTDFITFARTSP